MGRLTLNVLLSFAQFEREVTSERIRDKIAASKRKGLWVGGMAPLGYDTRDRKITVNEAEAERVRTIFESYLKLGSLNLVMADLRKRGIVTKVRTLRTGETAGGIAFTRGPLAHLLRNRFYIGEVAFKGEVLAGEQPAVIDRDLFDAVQARLSEQVTNHKVSRTGSEALLLGRIFDDRGHRMRDRPSKPVPSAGFRHERSKPSSPMPFEITFVSPLRSRTQSLSAPMSSGLRFSRINSLSNLPVPGVPNPDGRKNTAT
jgi:site-specific DNA recombinase